MSTWDFFDQFEAETRREITRVFLRRWWTVPCTSVVAGAALVGFGREDIGSQLALIWFGLVILCAGVMSIDAIAVRRGMASDLDARSSTMPWVYATMGVLFGAIFILNPAATMESSFRWPVLTLMLALSGVVINARIGSNPVGLELVVAQGFVAGIGLLAVGEVPTAAAVIGFVGVVMLETGNRQKVIDELIKVRMLSNVAAEEQAWAATHDDLTQLLNRTGIDRTVRSSRYPAEAFVSALFVDLDRFKEVNDTYGHAAGDEVIKEAAARIRRSFRGSDVIGRIGGDEFVVIVVTPTEEIAEMLATRLVARLDEPFEVASGDTVSISASVGMATTRGEVIDPEQLISVADAAMYQAKERGRNRLVRGRRAQRNDEEALVA